MKQYTLVLNFGYVESSGLSYMPFTSANRYKSAKDAVLDLALFLKEKYMERHSVKPRKCCIASKEKDNTAEFCSKCGRSLTEDEFDGEEFTEWLRRMEGANVDSFSEFIDYDDSNRWDTNWGPNQRFVYQAEWVLAAAVGYPHREDRTFEDICKERTKSKTENFSYY